MDDRAEDGHHGREAARRERTQVQPDLRGAGDRRPGEVSVPLYLLGSGPLLERARLLADVPTEDVFVDAQAFLPLEQRAPGVLLLLAEGLRAEDVVEVLRACVSSPGAWCPVLVESDARGLRALPLAPSLDYTLEEVAVFCRTGEGGLVFRVDDAVDRARAVGHDINNPLGAALVEVQMLLLDAQDDESRRAFGNLQDQLRLIKNMVAGLGFPGVRRRKPAPARQDV